MFRGDVEDHGDGEATGSCSDFKARGVLAAIRGDGAVAGL